MSTKYRIFIRRSALKELRKLPDATAERIERAIDRLAGEPRPVGCRKLHGSHDAYRIRVGDFRVVYEVEDSAVRIVVIRIGHRRDIYRSR